MSNPPMIFYSRSDLTNASSSSTGMRQPILGCSDTATSFDSSPDFDFFSIFGAGIIKSPRIEAEGICPINGTFKNLRFRVMNTAGFSSDGPRSIRVRLIVNGSNTGLTTLVDGAENEDNDFINSVSVTSGDRVCLAFQVSTNDIPYSTRWTTGLTWEACNKQAILLGGIEAGFLLAGQTYYGRIVGNSDPNFGDSNDLIRSQNIMPLNGNLKNFYVGLSDAPGVGNSRIFTIQKNGTDTSLSVTISDADTGGSNSVDSVSVQTSDLINVVLRSSGGVPTFTTPGWGVQFEPYANKKSPVLVHDYDQIAGADIFATDTLNLGFGSEVDGQYADPDPVFNNLTLTPCPGDFSVSDYFVKLGLNPGVNTSGATCRWGFTVRKNSANTSLAVNIAGGNDSQQDIISSFSVSNNDYVDIRVTQSNDAPAYIRACHGMVFTDVSSDFTCQLSGQSTSADKPMIWHSSAASSPFIYLSRN